MKPEHSLPRPAPTELELLAHLWREGPLSAREIHERGPDDRAYSTTRTLLERMVGKGLVTRERFHGLNIYEAAISRARGLAELVRHFARHALGSGPGPVLALFAAEETLSPEELEELRLLVDEAQEDADSDAGDDTGPVG